MGRVCSALPGSTVDGMGAPRARHYGPAVGNGAPSIPVPADPPPEASVLTVGRACGDRLMASGPIHMWARVGGGSAERAEGRSAGAARAGKRARRSGAQPGLEPVKKVVTRATACVLSCLG